MQQSILRIGLVAALGAAALSALAQQPITVTVNGQAVQFTGTPPQMVEGRVLVPLRGVFETMGAYVHWTSATQTVDARRGNTTVELQIGNHSAHVNGNAVNLDVPPELMNNTTLVPLRFISEALGADVDWLAAQETVAIRVRGSDEHFRPTPPPPPPPRRLMTRAPAHHWRAVFHINEVITVRLETPLSSDHNQPGDSFSTTLDTHGAPAFRGLPLGTQVMGHVADVRPRHGNDPGVIQLVFDRIVLPDGNSIPIMARLVGLDNQSVRKDRNGVLVANPALDRNGSAAAFVGFGGGSGAVVGIVSNGHVLRDATIGGSIGLLLSKIVAHPERAQDVHLAQGTPMGVRVMREADIP